MKVGFTGTRRGLTDKQKESLRLALFGATSFTHGDCIGADDEAAYLAHGMSIKVHCRPCYLHSQRAHNGCSEVIAKPLPPLQRNHDIVDHCDRLVACPGGMTQELRSGTWATIRYAIKHKKQVTVVWPDGRTDVNYKA